ncbi:MAG: V-type ATP synthase subunit F [Verrucomicrobiia bacterium]
MKFFCIADEDTVRGFRLAGVEGRVARTFEEASAALDEAMSQPNLGVVILTQDTAANLRERVDNYRLQRDQPLLLEIPGPGGPLPNRKSLLDLVHSAVGISLENKKGP